MIMKKLLLITLILINANANAYTQEITYCVNKINAMDTIMFKGGYKAGIEKVFIDLLMEYKKECDTTYVSEMILDTINWNGKPTVFYTESGILTWTKIPAFYDFIKWLEKRKYNTIDK